jgi:hypothetical protein
LTNCNDLRDLFTLGDDGSIQQGSVLIFHFFCLYYSPSFDSLSLVSLSQFSCRVYFDLVLRYPRAEYKEAGLFNRRVQGCMRILYEEYVKVVAQYNTLY